MRNRDQLGVNLKGNFYHTPCNNVNLAQHNIKYIALAQSRSSFGIDAVIKYYGVVKGIRVVKRREITERPKDSDEDYYVFEVDEWKELESKIEVSGYQGRKILYTTEFLLRNS